MESGWVLRGKDVCLIMYDELYNQYDIINNGKFDVHEHWFDIEKAIEQYPNAIMFLKKLK